METRLKPYREPASGIAMIGNLEWEAGQVKKKDVKCLY